MNTFIQHSQSINLKAAYSNLVEKEIHAFMCSYHRAGQKVYPSQNLLIEMTMSSKSTVKKAIDGLIEKGYIEVQQLGSGRTNTTYRIIVTLEQLEVMHPRVVDVDIEGPSPTEQPKVVVEAPKPEEPKIEQEASESVSAPVELQEGVMRLPRHTIPKQMVEQKVEVEVEVEFTKEYIAAAANHKGCSYYDMDMKIVKQVNKSGLIYKEYGPESSFYKQYQAMRAA